MCPSKIPFQPQGLPLKNKEREEGYLGRALKVLEAEGDINNLLFTLQRHS